MEIFVFERSPVTFAVIAVILGLAAFIKGLSGMGFPLISTPLLAMFIGVRMAIIVLNPPTLLLNLLLIANNSSFGFINLRRVSLLLPAGVIGLFVGTNLLVNLPEQTLAIGLGSLTIVFSIATLKKFDWQIPKLWELSLAPPIGFLSGCLGGVANAPGPLLVMFLSNLNLSPRSFVSLQALYYTVFGISQTISLYQLEQFNTNTLAFSAIMTAPILVGFGAGVWCQRRISSLRFRQIILGVLMMSGINLIVRSILD